MQSEYNSIIGVSENNKTSYDDKLMDFSAFRRNGLNYSESRCLQLKFMDSIICPVYTGLPIQGLHGTLKVALIDVVTGDVVKSCPEASAKLEFVVLDKNFNFSEVENWSYEDFDGKILCGRDGNSLLRGDPYVYLENGVVCVNNVAFRHSRLWFSKLNCRLGARLVDPSDGTRIREAKTEPFFAMDRRMMSKKHKPLLLTDEVSRLERIGKNGSLHNRLRQENISTVKNFLTEFYLNRERLQQILEACIRGKKWEVTIKHALTCKLDETRFLYFSPSFEPRVGVVFNIVGKLIGLFQVDRYVPVEEISASDKIHGCQLVVSAFQNCTDVKEYPNEDSLKHYLWISRIAINQSESVKVDSSTELNPDTSVMNENNIGATGFNTFSQGSVSYSPYIANANLSGDYYNPLILDHESEQQMEQLMELVYAEKARRWWKKVFYVLKWLFQLKKSFQFRTCSSGGKSINTAPSKIICSSTKV